jgi:hypothetical protein
MALNTVPNSVVASSALRKHAKDCARSVMRAVGVVVLLAVVIGWVTENGAVVLTFGAMVGEGIYAAWDGALYLLSVGGSFWGAVSVGGVALSAAAWCGCVYIKCEEINAAQSDRESLLKTFICAVVCWVMAFFALLSTYSQFAELSSYQGTALVIISLPWVVAAIAGFAAAGIIVTGKQ